MKIDLNSIDRENFRVDEHIIAGEKCYLVQPNHVGTKWSRETIIFRSSLWNSNGELISAGFPRFPNFGENPEVFPLPANLDGASIIDKRDGSLCIISRYKGQTIVRTRGTVDATQMANGHEIELFRSKYPEVFNFTADTANLSYLYEWETPENIICLRHPEPRLILVGIICHDDYSLTTQDELDQLAPMLGVERPKRYNFDSLANLIKEIPEMKGIEGVCLYFNNDQRILKIKTEEYLKLHRLKSELGSFERVVDMWFAIGKPSYQDAEAYINKQFDFEIFSLCRGDISRICDAYKEVERIVVAMKAKVDSIRSLPRKDAAMIIQQAYGAGASRTSMAFSLLSGRELNDEQLKKLLHQCVKE